MTTARSELAAALESLASVAKAAPAKIVGMHVVAKGQPGGGSVTGLHVSVTAGSGSGNVTGLRVTASSGDQSVNAAIAQDALAIARILREGGTPDKTTIESLLEKAKGIGSAAVNAAVAAVVGAMIKG